MRGVFLNFASQAFTEPGLTQGVQEVLSTQGATLEPDAKAGHIRVRVATTWSSFVQTFQNQGPKASLFTRGPQGWGFFVPGRYCQNPESDLDLAPLDGPDWVSRPQPQHRACFYGVDATRPASPPPTGIPIINIHLSLFINDWTWRFLCAPSLFNHRENNQLRSIPSSLIHPLNPGVSPF